MTTTDTVAEPPEQTPAGDRRAFLWPAIGTALAVLALVAEFCIIRWVSSPFATVLLTLSAILIALAAVGYLGTRQGHAAPFVVIALILPYLIGGVGAYASAQRVSSALGGIFGDTSASSDSSSSDGTGTVEGSPDDITDDNGDGVDDLQYSGADCKTDIEGGQQQWTECLANGGTDGTNSKAVEGSGAVEGESMANAAPLDGGSYRWSNGVKLTLNVTRTEPWGSTDDYCGDGSCGVSRPNDLRWVLHYKVSAPSTVANPIDLSSCPGDLHTVNGNDDKAFVSVDGDYASNPGDKVLPGATKSGDAEFSISRASVGKDFYLESMCGDSVSGEEIAYFGGAIMAN